MLTQKYREISQKITSDSHFMVHVISNSVTQLMSIYKLTMLF